MVDVFASVIIPAFNEEKTIGKCLNALKQQDFKKNSEIIVVDDGSTDSTQKIVQEFKDVKLLKQKNSGPAVARNNGAKNAKGEIIVFIDADCVAEKNWLSEMLKPFEDEKISGVQGCYKSNQKEFMAKFSQIEIEQRYEKLSKGKFIDFIGSYSAAYRKKVFEKFNGFDENFPIASGEDPDLSYRIAEKGHKLLFNPKAIVYHTHQTSLLKYLKTKFFRAYWRILLYKKHSEKIVKDSYTPQTLKFQIILFYLGIILLASGFFIKEFLFISILAFLLIFVFTIPFFLFALKKNFVVAIVSPFILFLRTVAFSLGLVAGILAGVASK